MKLIIEITQNEETYKLTLKDMSYKKFKQHISSVETPLNNSPLNIKFIEQDTFSTKLVAEHIL